MIGTVLNTATVIAGGTLGALLGDRLPERVRSVLMQGIGLTTLVIGAKMALGTTNILIVLAAIVLGGIAGELAGLEEKLERAGRFLEARAARVPFLARGDFTRGFVTASLLFCVGPMAILGSFQDGLSGDFELLAVKSTLDGVAGLALASTLGMGVTCAAAVVLVYQGALTLGAGLLQPLLSPAMVTEFTAVGGVIILGIGLGLLEVKRVRVASLLPALAVAPILVALLATLGLT